MFVQPSRHVSNDNVACASSEDNLGDSPDSGHPDRADSHGASHTQSAFGIARRIWSAWLDHVVFVRAQSALEALDDRSLQDLGISRSEIHVAVRRGREAAVPPGQSR
jgi:uncharacterized protein YjiS (DUF1127 family)